MGPDDRERGRSTQLWLVLSRAFDAVREHAARDVARHDLSLSEYRLLDVLRRGGPARPGDLRSDVPVSSGGITYLVDRLEERRLVARSPHPDDRRARLVALTERGRGLIERIRPQHAAALEYATSGLDAAAKRRAVELLRELAATADDLERLDEG